jgi:hypothetical protein
LPDLKLGESIIKNQKDFAKICLLAISNSKIIQMPALRIIGNIAVGNKKMTQAVIDNDGLLAISKGLSSNDMNIRKECCWSVSNILAGTL